MEDLGIIELDDWLFDPLKKTLVKISSTPNSEVTEENLEARHSDLLLHLIQLNGEVASRENLIQDVWKNRYVDDRTINSTISRLRKLLGGDKNRYIKTQSKQGYKFVGNYKFIERSKLTKSPSFHQAETIPVKVKIATIGIVTIIICLLALIFNKIASQPEVIQVSEIEIEPMTYEEGSEHSPSISHDGRYLAYIHVDIVKDSTKVAIQDLQNKKTIYVSTGDISTSPVWHSNSYKLYYATQIDGKCEIYTIDLLFTLEIKETSKISTCGSRFNYPSIDISSDANWLYYTFSDENSPNIIKRININNLEAEVLTFPPVSMQGDFNISLNLNDEYLSFVRYYDDLTNDLMFLHLSTGSLINVSNGKHFVNSATWSSTQSEDLLFSTDRNTLFQYSLLDKKVIPIFKYSQGISDPVHTLNKDILLSIGGALTADVYHLDLSLNEPVATPVIVSSFTDHSPDLSDVNESNVVAFSSNRSGSFQIWLQSNENLKKLTDLPKDSYISDISISNSMESLLFKLNDKFHFLNIGSNAITPLKLNFDFTRNATWHCENNDIVFITVSKNGVWQLIEYDLKQHSYSIVKNSITTIKSDCKNETYFATVYKKNYLEILDIDMKVTESIEIKDIDFSNYHSWTLMNRNLYFTKDLELYEFELHNKSTTKIQAISKPIHQLTHSNNRLIFSVLEQQDSYIGKITSLKP